MSVQNSRRAKNSVIGTVSHIGKRYVGIVQPSEWLRAVGIEKGDFVGVNEDSDLITVYLAGWDEDHVDHVVPIVETGNSLGHSLPPAARAKLGVKCGEQLFMKRESQTVVKMTTG